MLNSSKAEEPPLRSTSLTGGMASRKFTFKDDMGIFSPRREVEPITLSLDKEGTNDCHPKFVWNHSSKVKQDETLSFSQLGSTPTASSMSDGSFITPPESWGTVERLYDKYAFSRQPVNSSSRSLTSESTFSGSQGLSLSTSQTNTSSLTGSRLNLANLHARHTSSNQETSMGFAEGINSTSLSLGTKGITGQANFESLGSALTIPRRFSTYAERISNSPSFSDGTPLSVGSPKTKKTGAEMREELLNSLLSRSDMPSTMEAAVLPSTNVRIGHDTILRQGGTTKPQKIPAQPEQTSFTLQLFQRNLEETLGSFEKSIHEDMRNLHIEVLRQFHTQEMEMSSVTSTILQNQAELMKEVQSLREETQQLRLSL